MFVTRQGRAGFAFGGPSTTQSRGAYFVPFPASPPSRAQPHSFPEWAPFFTTKDLPGSVRSMGGVGPWPGVGAGKEEKYTPPRAGEQAGARNFAGGRVSWGPGDPITDTMHYPLLPLPNHTPHMLRAKMESIKDLKYE